MIFEESSAASGQAESGLAEGADVAIIQLECTTFRLAQDLGGLVASIVAENRGALRMPGRSYRQVRLALSQELASRFGQNARQYKDVSFAGLYCAGCRWEYPESYRNSLFLEGRIEQEFGPISGAVPGYLNFGGTGRCPLCGCEESLYVYESFLPEAITEASLEGLKSYWQQQARRWWRLAEERELSCAWCGTPILRNQGYLFQAQLLCTNCLQSNLQGGVQRLQSYPHYFGLNLLRKARCARK